MSAVPTGVPDGACVGLLASDARRGLEAPRKAAVPLPSCTALGLTTTAADDDDAAAAARLGLVSLVAASSLRSRRSVAPPSSGSIIVGTASARTAVAGLIIDATTTVSLESERPRRAPPTGGALEAALVAEELLQEELQEVEEVFAVPLLKELAPPVDCFAEVAPRLALLLLPRGDLPAGGMAACRQRPGLFFGLVAVAHVRLHAKVAGTTRTVSPCNAAVFSAFS